MAKVTAKEVKESKALVEKLLMVKGISYNDWLQQQHKEFIEGNQDLILQALTAFSSQDQQEYEDQDEEKEEDRGEEKEEDPDEEKDKRLAGIKSF